MITIRLKGGLGNQLFQYAAGRALSIKNNTGLLLDASKYSSPIAHEDRRSLSLHAFNIQAVIKENPTTSKKLRADLFKIGWRLKDRFWHENALKFYPSILNIHSKNMLLEGFWNSELYFSGIKDIIRKDLTLKKELGGYALSIKKAITDARNNEFMPVSLSIRRGDYVWSPSVKHLRGVCEPDYYLRAIQTLTALVLKKYDRSKIHYFINSDDADWVSKEILPLLSGEHITVCEAHKIKDYEQLMLISYCDHNIIANSSFSWWGAWLNSNEDKIVIAPRKWRNDGKEENINCAAWVGV